jgi:nitrogen-specific signal transduction histidine kinase/ActR/RegA family two-component response regulator
MRETPEGKEMFCIDIDLKPIKEAENQRQELEEQLRQKHKMEAIGTMAGGIAHDFNNHLAIILGNVEMAALKLPQDSTVKPYIEQIKTAANRSKELVKQILIYSRRNPLTLKPTKLVSILDETLKLLRPTIPSSIDIEHNISNGAEQLSVAADATQLQQILINLCSNAVHAMDEKGTLKIDLVATTLDEKQLPPAKGLPAGEYLQLTVSDTGTGMPEEVLNKIFDPFFTTKDVHQGTGMGLAVVQGIVEGHNGFITATSTPGEGSRFDIYFPVISDSTEQPPADDAPLPTGTERVLVLDDEENLAALCAEILTEHGYRVSKETSSQKVAQLFKEDPDRFDLLITDQTMPGLSGTELAKQILAIRPELPIILCTGYSAKISAHAAKNIGISEYCMKPLNLNVLVSTTRKVLDRAKRAGQAGIQH